MLCCQIIAIGPDKGRYTAAGEERGAPCGYGGINVTEDVRDLLVKGLIKFYEVGAGHKPPPFTRAFRQTLATFFAVGFRVDKGKSVPILPPVEDCLTIRQARYWYLKERDPDEAFRKRYGEKKYNLRFRELTGDTSRLLVVVQCAGRDRLNHTSHSARARD